jgi:2-polyprenyl-3-methyl-5-hydroxy-6-metoxy-1,4-benzoquinol methylase
MLTRLRQDLTAERTRHDDAAMAPTFAQHQRAYAFCTELAAQRRVLEIGCGSGYGTARLAEAATSVIGLDNDASTIATAAQEYRAPNLTFVHADVGRYVPPQPVDLVVSLQVIEHLADPRPFLARIRTLLAPGGCVVLSTPNAVTQSYNENPYHFREYRSDELRTLLGDYFAGVDLLGVHGDAAVMHYEAVRKQQVLAVLSKDLFAIRRWMPRAVLQLAGDVATRWTRRRLAARVGMAAVQALREENYSIGPLTEDAIDLIAVCR